MTDITPLFGDAPPPEIDRDEGRTLLMMRNPRAWPLWPLLPLVNIARQYPGPAQPRPDGQPWPLFGVLRFPDVRAVILVPITHKLDSVYPPGVWEALPTETYEDDLAMVRAGWRVD